MFGSFKHQVAALVVIGLAAVAPQVAQAAGTASGTSISNTATLDFSVSGVLQTAVTTAPATFVVDTKINFTVVTTDGAAIPAAPGGTGYVLNFTVTNNGNKTEDFGLATTAMAGGTVLTLTDNIDAAAVSVFVESGATAGYQALEDTATYIDELAADASKIVYIINTGIIPTTAVDSDVAGYDLTATAKVSGGVGTEGAAEAETAAGSETIGGVDVTFADAAGTATGDAARDGKHSDRSGYKVTSAQLSVTKSVAVVSDPIHGVTNPQAIPGAVMEYTITIANAVGSGASATLSSIGDVLNSNITIDAGAGVAAWTLTDGTNTDTGTLTADTTTTDGLEYVAGSRTLTYTISTFLITGNTTNNGARASGGDLQAGESLALTFRVTIN